MTEEMLRTVLETAEVTVNPSDKEGWAALREGHGLTLYAAHDGVPLTVNKVEAVRVSQGVIRARNYKGEVFLLAVSDVFAAALDARTEATSGRKAGFIG